MPPDDPITVAVGDVTLTVPPMPFYCLRRAWPHIVRLGEMSKAPAEAAAAQAAFEAADPDSLGRPFLAAQVEAAQARLDAASLVFQTDEALAIIAAALALSHDPPTVDDLGKTLRPDQIAGVHATVNRLLDASGMFLAGETVPAAMAAISQPAISPSSLN
jgi:hypothetical protein